MCRSLIGTLPERAGRESSRPVRVQAVESAEWLTKHGVGRSEREKVMNPSKGPHSNRCGSRGEKRKYARQEVALADCDKVFIDKASGKNTERPQLQAMLGYVREGDVLVVESYSRLSRSTADLLRIVETLKSKGVNFISLKERTDTTTPQGELVMTIFAGIAQFEREQLLQRQREGIAIAKEQGKYKGRQRIAIDDAAFEKTYAEWKGGRITAVKAMERLGLKPNTFYRRVREYEESRAE